MRVRSPLLAAKDARITGLEAQLAAKDARIAELECKLEELTQWVAALEAQVDRNASGVLLRHPRAVEHPCAGTALQAGHHLPEWQPVPLTGTGYSRIYYVDLTDRPPREVALRLDQVS